MNRFFLEIKIGFFVIVGVALVLATGYLAYTGITSIVDSIAKEAKPDVKLALIQHLAFDLQQAENGIRLYAYSKDDNDLSSYRNLLETVDGQIENLLVEGHDNPQFLANVDTISDLVERKFLLWNEMLPLYTTKQTEQYLDTISKELETKIESDSLRKNRSLFKKIFKRMKKLEIDEKKIVAEIGQAKEDDKQVVDIIRNKERQLASANSKLTKQLYELIRKIEVVEKNLLDKKIEHAQQLANESFKWIGWFALSATVALLFVVFFVTRYIKKSKDYEVALVEAKNEAENLAIAKELFVANVSHEVRTPMNVISGFTSQLLQKSHDEETTKSLKIIKSSSDHLVRIINDILDFSKLESGKMKLEPVHFHSGELFQEMNLLFQNQAAEKGIGLNFETDKNTHEILFGDPVRLKQIVINLLGNAIKFTDKGKVTLAVSSEKKSDNQVELTLKVSDTGIGIPENNLDMIFDDFSQAEGSSQKFGGTGLGLSIVKKLILLHKGEIKVISTEGSGSEFICSIPYKIGDLSKIEKKTDVQIDVPAKIKSLKFLIVDDEVYNRKLIESIFAKWKVVYDVAENGKQAIEKIKTADFDVILMDKRMPVMSGTEAAEIIRKQIEPGRSKLNIIMITAENLSKKNMEKYKLLGFDEFLNKPFAEEDLLKKLLKKTGSTLKKAVQQPELKHGEEKSSSGLVDLTQLYRVSANDTAFVMEMLEKFIDSFESGFKVMVDAIQSNKYEEIGNAAHKLASPCRHLGADELLNMLKEIEEWAEINPASFDFQGKANDVFIVYEKVKIELQKHLADTKK